MKDGGTIQNVDAIIGDQLIVGTATTDKGVLCVFIAIRANGEIYCVPITEIDRVVQDLQRAKLAVECGTSKFTTGETV